jgi:ElaB/YqjD/DUF883 family membrane-anchored ribosome-binding protein
MANPGNRGVFSEQQRGHEAGRGGNRPEEQAAGMMGTVKDKASELASNVASTAEQAWDATRETAQNVASTVASTAEDAWDSMSSFMRRYPIATFCIGAGFGFLLAELLTSRRS